MIFEVSHETIQESREIYQKILWLYQDMVTSYGGFGHNLDYEDIDYMKFIFTYTEDETGYGHIATTISQGALISICCEAVNLLDEESRSQKFEEGIQQILSSNMVKHFKEVESVLKKIIMAFSEQKRVDWECYGNGRDLCSALKNTYQTFVIGYYKSMVEKGKESIR